MRIVHCTREAQVLDALRSGRWSSAWGEEIRRHVSTCTLCAEVVFVAQVLQHDDELASARLQHRGTELPSAGLVWWRAQLAARRAAEHQAAQPIALAERAAYILGALTALAVTMSQRARILGWVLGTKSSVPPLRLLGLRDSLLPGDWFHGLGQTFAQGGPSHVLLMLVALSAAAALTVLALAAYVLSREE